MTAEEHSGLGVTNVTSRLNGVLEVEKTSTAWNAIPFIPSIFSGKLELTMTMRNYFFLPITTFRGGGGSELFTV